MPLCAEAQDSKSEVDLTLAGVARAFSSESLALASEEENEPSPESGGKHASVALILRERSRLEMLLIERARRPNDPWSGQVAMPGGGQDLADADSIHTAMRETSEEVGLALSRSQWMGTLGSLSGHRRIPQLVITGHCFGVPPETDFGELERAEVADAFWVPLDHLLSGHRAVNYRYGEMPDSFPGLLLPDARNVLWGLTHRFVDVFLSQLGGALALPDATSETREFRAGL